jgi:BirA family biotin operon repressor/biotin-[acetyl-CoA-carboxylase] ligase
LLRLKPGDPPAQQLGFVAALALHSALSAWVQPKRLMLKWPNDVLLEGQKLSGILLEREGDAVIAGFGVNLAHHPEDVERPAMSLAAAAIDPPSPDAMMQALADSWDGQVMRWRTHGFGPIRESWMQLAHPAGAELLARLVDGQECRGRYDGLGDDGSLLLRLGDGTVRTIHAGDVFAL